MQFFLDSWKGFKKAPVPAKAVCLIIGLYLLGSLLAPSWPL